MQETINLDDQAFAALPTRERILKTASDLFYRFSIHTVGIDRIIAESGVAKMTFYKHFPSKARLVADYLRHKNVVWLQMLANATDQPGLAPVERVLAIFDALDGSFHTAPFRGCPFVRGLAEFGPDAESPEVQATIAAYFQSLHDLVADLIVPMALSNPDKAVLQILSLIQGAIVMAQTTSDPLIAEANRDAAAALLRATPNTPFRADIC
ncbi:TetR/AcrR family transcriptional regulator [Sphingobium tyrosinilyticum]|uniref:TetR/AcrR family transcriptional regulator n=1 Tax=Sphingobium tyrosinilyticum TaxID=2715436 RepID=A0ABV9F416_9SPHN